MRRLLAAVVWLRWRLLLNGLRGGRRRDVLERFSRIAGLLAPAIVFALFISFSLVLGGLGFMAGVSLGRAPDDPKSLELVVTGVRLLLFVVTVVLIVIPLGRSLQSGFPGAARLLLLPIPRSLMHLIDVAAGLLDPWLAFLIPGIVLLSAGLLVAGRVFAASAALGAGVVLLAALASLSALTSSVMQWILRDRRRGEAAALLFMAALSMSALIPAFAIDPGKAEKEGVRLQLPRSPWTLAVPTEMYAWTLRASLTGAAGVTGAASVTGAAGAPAGIAGLTAQAVILFWLSSRMHARLLITTAGSGPRASGPLPTWRDPPLPGVVPQAAAVARAQVTTALRTVRGKLAVYLNGPMVLTFGFMIHRFFGSGDGQFVRFTVDGPSLFGISVLFTLLTLQPVLLNQFATDRAGLTLQFLSPVGVGDLILGKAAGGLCLVALSSAFCLVAALIATPAAPALLWISALLGAAATGLLMTPVMSFLSIVFPRRADLSKMGHAGNAHAAGSLLATLATVATAAPGSLILASGSLLGTEVVSAGLSLVWLAAAAGLSWLLMRALPPMLAARRENLFHVAAGG